jgi:hypothetical protein
LALLLALSGTCAWAVEAPTEEPAVEVDLGPQATATPMPPTATAVPTAAPVSVPTATVEASAAPASPSAKAAQDLNDVRFDKGHVMEAEDGLMIIAPGAATAEDSLESFGIDSPFNWKNNGKAVLEPGKAVEGEDSLELAAPDSSDLKERVRVETGEGNALPSDSDYDLVERAGIVVGASEYRVDGRLARTKDGQYFARRGTQVALRMEAGRQVYPGSIYTVFRESGLMRGLQQQRDVGMLLRNVGVLKVVRIEGEEVLARVEKQYETIREGDLVHLRDPDRLRYYNSVRQGASATVPLDLQGEVVGVDPLKMSAKPGDIVYLDLGRAQGVAPGLKLTLYRSAPEPGIDELRDVKVTGRMGQVVVINVSRDSSVARVVRSNGEVRPGDRVRYR